MLDYWHGLGGPKVLFQCYVLEIITASVQHLPMSLSNSAQCYSMAGFNEVHYTRTMVALRSMNNMRKTFQGVESTPHKEESLQAMPNVQPF